MIINKSNKLKHKHIPKPILPKSQPKIHKKEIQGGSAQRKKTFKNISRKISKKISNKILMG